MNKKVFGVIMFAVGAAIGSAVTWKVVKTKYEQIADEEINSVRDEYISLMQKMKKQLKETVAREDSDESASEENDDDYYPDDDERDFAEKEKAQIEYYKMTSKYRSGDGTEENDDDYEEGGTGDEDEVPYINGPYVISPDEFASGPPGFFAQPLDYFADGVLADSWGVKIDIEETIGEEALEHFGDYVDDVVHVRNERKEIDYEVTRDPRTYDDMLATNPNPYYGT